jgi:hypothetical protein
MEKTVLGYLDSIPTYNQINEMKLKENDFNDFPGEPTLNETDKHYILEFIETVSGKVILALVLLNFLFIIAVVSLAYFLYKEILDRMSKCIAIA